MSTRRKREGAASRMEQRAIELIATAERLATAEAIWDREQHRIELLAAARSYARSVAAVRNS